MRSIWVGAVFKMVGTPMSVNRVAVLASLVAVFAVFIPLPQPYDGRVVVIEVAGGTDKEADGHRADTHSLLHAFRQRNWAATTVFYNQNNSEAQLKELAASADAFLSRVDPGEYVVYLSCAALHGFLRLMCDDAGTKTTMRKSTITFCADLLRPV